MNMLIKNGQLFAKNGEQVLHAVDAPEFLYGGAQKKSSRKIYLFKGDYGYCPLKIGTGSALYNQEGLDFHLDNFKTTEHARLYKFKVSDLTGYNLDICFVLKNNHLYILLVGTEGYTDNDLIHLTLKEGALFLNNLEFALFRRINILP